jgi:hypothetical protein
MKTVENAGMVMKYLVDGTPLRSRSSRATKAAEICLGGAKAELLYRHSRNVPGRMEYRSGSVETLLLVLGSESCRRRPNPLVRDIIAGFKIWTNMAFLVCISTTNENYIEKTYFHGASFPYFKDLRHGFHFIDRQEFYMKFKLAYPCFSVEV